MRRAILLVGLAAVLGWAAHAWAATNIRLCYTLAGPVDTTKVRLFLAGTATVDNIHAGATESPPGTWCATIPLPASHARGATVEYTLKAVNVWGEESPASNAVGFRAPAVPAGITFTDLSPVP
jgi:hypothetical protein